MLYIIIAILMFGILIALHEFGHFITAKLLGVRVNEFAIGMGPLLFSTQKGETQYSLRAIPMGGFCAMEGEDEDSSDPGSFSNKPAWKKFIVLVAGSFMNFLTGFVLLAFLLSSSTSYVLPVIDDFMEGFPYESAQGLLPGDRILSVDGERIYTKSDLDNWANLVARSIRAAGGKPGDTVHVAYGYGLFTGGLGAHYGAERAGCTVIPMSGGQTEKQVQLIRDFQPDIIMVTPSYMQVINEEFVRQGVDPRESSLKIGIFGAEPWTEAMRREIEGKAGLDAVDIYGLSEVMGPGVASECVESKDGPVIWEDHFYPEIIDPDTGEVLPDGAEGELVFTSLTKEALPIIRYRTRDLTRLLPPTARSFRRMGKIVGRSDDMLIIRGVNVFPTQIEEIVLQHEKLSGQYQILVSRDGNLDRVTVRCELQPGVPEAVRADVTGWVQHRIKTLVGISSDVEVLNADSIERTLVGKARRVIDQRAR